MKTINEHIRKQEFQTVYLICGSEGYLRKQAKDKLHKALVAPDDTMNYSYYEGKRVNPVEVMELAETLPFFSDRRLLILENTNLFQNTPDALIQFIKEIPETTCMIFVEQDMDKRGKLYKTISQHGYVANMDPLDEKQLITWAVSLIAKEGRKITESTIRLLLEKTGTDMDNIKNELEKLFSYTLGREEITREDVEAIATTITTSKIFDMMNAIATRKQRQALDLYYDLLSLKEPPMRILSLLTRQFNLLMQTKDLARLNFSNAEAGKKVGLAPFIVKKYIEQGRSFSIDRLKEMVQECAQTEESVKTGRLNDLIGVELLIINFSS